MPTSSQFIESIAPIFSDSGKLLVYNPKASEPIVSVIFKNNLIKIHADVYAINIQKLIYLLEKFSFVEYDEQEPPSSWEYEQAELSVTRCRDAREVVMAIASVCKDSHVFSLEFQKTCKSLREEA